MLPLKCTKKFMQFWHIVSYETSHSAFQASRKSRSIIRIINLTDYEELAVTKSLRTIHNNDEVTSLLDNKGIELLIVVLREIEKDIGTIATITLITKDRKSLDSLNLNIPLNNKRIDTLESVLWFTFGVDILKCFSKMCNCVLIVQCRY